VPDVAIDLAARHWVLVENEHVEAGTRRVKRSCHAGWASTDNHKVHRLDCHASALAPAIGLISIPSRTRTMQACWFGKPSISTRQSKQTPIMQYGARGAAPTGV
jgi:hypothetical protein